MKINLSGERLEGKTSLAIFLFQLLRMVGFKNIELVGRNDINTTQLKNELKFIIINQDHLKDLHIEIVDKN